MWVIITYVNKKTFKIRVFSLFFPKISATNTNKLTDKEYDFISRVAEFYRQLNEKILQFEISYQPR